MIELEALIADQQNKTISVAVYDFETGKKILINADESFHPASTFKVHVMMEVFRQARAGDVYHDTGIVFPEGRKPYAISIMTRGFAEDKPEDAHDCRANVSKMVYEQIQ